MPSGKRHSVVVFCVSPLKELYTESTNLYDPDVIYVFKSKDKKSLNKISNDIYNSVTFKCNSIKIIETETDNYQSVLAELVNLTRKIESMFENVDFFFNITSGTHEFAGAATYIAMAKENVTAFSVDVINYGIKEYQMRELIGKLSMKVNEPKMIDRNKYVDSNDEVLGFLVVLDEISVKTKYPNHADIIGMLKERNIWTHNPKKKCSSERTPIEKREEMYLSRHYFKPAIERGWIADNKKKIELTESGRTMIGIFGPKEQLPPMMMDEMCCDSSDFVYRSHIIESRERSAMHKLLELNISSSPDDLSSDEIADTGKGRVVTFEHKGKKYKFRSSIE